MDIRYDRPEVATRMVYPTDTELFQSRNPIARRDYFIRTFPTSNNLVSLNQHFQILTLILLKWPIPTFLLWQGPAVIVLGPNQNVTGLPGLDAIGNSHRVARPPT